MCRHSAVEISKVKAFLDGLGVRLVAVGFDALGLQGFVNGGFFAGELMLDTEMEAYRGLRLNRMGFVSSMKAVANPKVWKIIKSVVFTNPIPGDFEGDGMQLGATYVVDKGGEVVYSHKQTFYGDIPSQEKLKAEVLKCRHLKQFHASETRSFTPSFVHDMHTAATEDACMHASASDVHACTQAPESDACMQRQEEDLGVDLNDDSGFLG